MAEHSIYAPSSLPRLLSCPASFQESLKVKREESSKYARKGSLKHEAVVSIWPHYVANNISAMNKVFAQTQELARIDGGFTYLEEDHQEVLECCDRIKMQLVTCGPNATIQFELRVTLEPWNLPDIWGTADVVIDDPDNKRMIVDDHKFGAGVPVYAEKNLQLLTYTAGAAGYPLAYDEYTCCVFQPPLNSFSDYTVNAKELEEFVNEIHLGIERCKSPDAEYVPSTKSCKFCPARTSCRAKHELAVHEAQQVFKIAERMPNISAEEKSYLAGLLTNLEQVKKTLYADIQATIMNGEAVPGWKIVAGRSTRKWHDEATAMKWLMSNKALSEDNMFTQKFISPAKAEKMNRTLKNSEEFKVLINKPVGKPQLVGESDRRPDFNVNDTADAVFNKVEKEN